MEFGRINLVGNIAQWVMFWVILPKGLPSGCIVSKYKLSLSKRSVNFVKCILSLILIGLRMI